MQRRQWLKLFGGALAAGPLFGARYTPAVAEWNRPVEPRRIAGNLYYVGAAGVSSFLFADPAGHILVDTGFRETVPLIDANLKKLGFRLEDVRVVLSNHAHYDHCAGLAEVKRRTKARFLANPADAPAYERGGLRDFAFGDRFPFEPVTPDGALRDGEEIVVGQTRLKPVFTPGHTKGCTTFTTRLEDKYNVVLAGSVSAPGYRLVGNTAYPEMVRDFEASFARLRALPCEIFLSFHGWDFDLERKLAARGPNPFVDPQGLGAYVDRSRAAFQKLLAQQR